MLQKNAKPPSRDLIRGGVKAVIVFETLLFFSTWIGWQRLRSSRSFIVNKTSHIYWRNIIHSKNTHPPNLRTELRTGISGKRKANYINEPLFSMAFVKSVLYLVGCGGFAYLLLETITPKDSDIKKLSADFKQGVDRKDRAAFLEVLKKSAYGNKTRVEDKQISSTQSAVEK